jgi:hypothetical protein
LLCSGIDQGKVDSLSIARFASSIPRRQMKKVHNYIQCHLVANRQRPEQSEQRKKGQIRPR